MTFPEPLCPDHPDFIKEYPTWLPDPNIFGTCEDGDIIIAVNTTLTRDIHARDFTVNAGVTLTTHGYKILCCRRFINNGTITDVGNGGLGGAGGIAAYPNCPDGNDGGNGLSPDGMIRLGGGGGGGACGAAKDNCPGVDHLCECDGGGGGDGGGLVWIAAPYLMNNGTITVNGTAGNNGECCGKTNVCCSSGGGGGGGGGLIMLIYKYYFLNYTATATGGAGGAAVSCNMTGLDPACSCLLYCGSTGGDGGDGYSEGGEGHASDDPPCGVLTGGDGDDCVCTTPCTAGGGGGGGACNGCHLTVLLTCDGGDGGDGGNGCVMILRCDTPCVIV